MPIVRKEKMLIYGGPSSGKSYGLLEWGFNLHMATNGKKRTFIMDTDDGLAKALYETERFRLPDGSVWEPNVWPVRSWPDADKAITAIQKLAPTQGELVCAEMVGRIWEFSQNHYIEQKFGVSAAQYFLTAAAEGKGGKPALNPLVDWTVIKNLYASIIGRLFGSQANVIMTAGAKDVVDFLATDTVKDMFSGIGGKPAGVKPDGNKNDPYVVDTVLYLQRERVVRGEDRVPMVLVTTVKDRGRQLLQDYPTESVFTDYYAAHGLSTPWEIAA